MQKAAEEVEVEEAGHTAEMSIPAAVAGADMPDVPLRKDTADTLAAVWLGTGEASIQMCIQELSTCKQYHLPIKIVNLNNRYLGMVRQWQEFFYGNRYAESYMDALPDFVKLADAYGHVGIKIEKPGDVEAALKEAFRQKDRLVFMDFVTDQTENVFPMVPGGKGLTEMILTEEL